SLGDGAYALFSVGDFPHVALLAERVERCGDIALGQQLNGGLQSRVFLTHNLIELGGAHPGFLELLEWAAGLDSLMLADVTDEKYVVAGAKPHKELADLVCAGKARFIDKVQVFLVTYVWFCSAGKKSLQGSCLNSCFIQFARRARGRGKTLDPIAL